ncbi:photo-regulated tyrosinase [Mycena alexandri]|uniref:tyrosinase n=1 Tax=Mycena alexandri TaxID=1745969 RepID=A0AAD6S7D4_9AGAR|nr:photo-regulated tyrosinase [Mycena alexandri]
MAQDPTRPPNRLEINSFVQNIREFFDISTVTNHLLEAMYNQDQDKVLTSYFQLAAIHGYPFMSWNNSGATVNDDAVFWGYCTHGTILFPTWHRPYMALFEQTIQENAIGIAKKYTSRADEFLDAAYDLRLPYWDWGADIIPPSQIWVDTVVEIIQPNGVAALAPNPFLSYEFHPTPQTFYDNFKIWPQTLRYPTSEKRDAISNTNLLYKDNTFKLLTADSMRTWDAFSNNSASPDGGGSNSLEAIHDDIHSYIGGFDVPIKMQGHMAEIPLSSFDPIFWLHHANVDRLLSLWSAMNRGVWVPTTGGPSYPGTWTIGANTTVDENTDLTPFWKDANHSAYTPGSTDIMTDSLGYTYPEFNDLRNDTPPQVQAAIETFVQQKYGPPKSSIAVPVPLVSGRPAIVSKDGHFFISSGPVVAGAQGATAKVILRPLITSNNGHYFISSTAAADPHTKIPEPPTAQLLHEWSVRVRVEKFALQGSFSIVFFLGPVPAKAQEWHTSPSFAGARAIFSNSNLVGCGNCRVQARAAFIVEGFVHLNIARPELAAMDPEAVKAYLREHLSWRVLYPKRHPVHSDDVPSLEVLVHARRIRTNPGDTLPSHGEPQWFPEITEGREF